MRRPLTASFEVGETNVDLEYSDIELQSEAESLAIELASRLADRSGISEGDVIQIGFASAQAHRSSSGRITLWEIIGRRTKRGVNESVQIRRDQKSVCVAIGAHYQPVSHLGLVAFDSSVLKGARTEGVRYLESGSSTGWFITSEEFSGNVAELRIEHAYHVTDRRPDILPYLGLPPGHRFDLFGDRGAAWADAEALR